MFEPMTVLKKKPAIARFALVEKLFVPAKSSRAISRTLCSLTLPFHNGNLS